MTNVNANSPQLAIIVPTYNETGNIASLYQELEQSLQALQWELIIVDDDSPDGTTETVTRLAQQHSQVRVIRRIGRRGLAGACIEGLMASSAPLLAVMDADGQHNPKLLPQMVATLSEKNIDLVIASRYTDGGSVGDFSPERRHYSEQATRLAKSLLKVKLSDPMSGYFMLRRAVIHDCVKDLSGIGYKILLDIVASSRKSLQIRELPLTFRERKSGESKLDNQVVWAFVMLLLDKRIGRYIPVRFIPFALVGGFGVLVHMAVLSLSFHLLGNQFAAAQTIATLVAMSGNFLLNNELTYRDQRLRGWSMLRGWVSFVLACSIGAIANVGIAVYLYDGHSGWLLSALAGIAVGSVWNYAVTALYTWGRRK